MMGYLVVHEELGVFLGATVFPQLLYWSKVQPCDIDAAPVFADVAGIGEFLKRLPGNIQVMTLPVRADVWIQDRAFASFSACVEAGAGSWLDPQTPTIGPIQ